MNLTPEVPTYAEWEQRNKDLSELETRNQIDFILSYVARALEMADNVPISIRYNWKNTHPPESEMVLVKKYLFQKGFTFTYEAFGKSVCRMTIDKAAGAK